jgi:hypothetical protein
MLRRAVILVVLLILAMPGATAHAQGSPFTPLPPGPTPAPPPPPSSPTPSSNKDDGGLSGLQQALIFAAGGVLLLGIGIAIVLDARRKAPVRAARGHAAEGREQRDPHRERAKAQARRKQKAARAQRKRNR